MKKLLIAVVVVVLLVALVGAQVAGSYNRLVQLDESISGQWAQVENQLQRRYDLIPNLVEVVKGYAAHEREVFEAIAEARARLAGAQTGSVEDRVAASNELEGALSRLLMIVENYPDLKADTQFTALFDELTGTENRIATERMRYNDSVRSFNETIRQFPMLFFARMFGFATRAYFEISPGAATAPEVRF